MSCNSNLMVLFSLVPLEDHSKNSFREIFVVSIINYSWLLFWESSFKDSNNHFMKI